jgi:hypothetical protein
MEKLKKENWYYYKLDNQNYGGRLDKICKRHIEFTIFQPFFMAGAIVKITKGVFEKNAVPLKQ